MQLHLVCLSSALFLGRLDSSCVQAVRHVPRSDLSPTEVVFLSSPLPRPPGGDAERTSTRKRRGRKRKDGDAERTSTNCAKKPKCNIYGGVKTLNPPLYPINAREDLHKKPWTNASSEGQIRPLGRVESLSHAFVYAKPGSIPGHLWPWFAESDNFLVNPSSNHRIPAPIPCHLRP